MGETIRNAVQLALGGFLSLASGKRGADLRTPAAPAVEGAYQLGRGEARSGRSTDALLAAYRIGARVSWRELSLTAVRNGIDGEVLVDFAELVFAYIDELSAASVAGHTDETETTGRVRQRLLAKVGQLLLAGAPDDEVLEAVERAGWPPPSTLTAVLVPEAQVRPVLGAVAQGTLEVTDLPDAEAMPAGWALLLVPDVHQRRRGALLRTLGERGVAGRPDGAVARGAGVLRPRGPGPRPRHRDRHRGRTSPGWCCTPTRRRSPTCAPRCSHRCRACGRRPRRSSPTPCAPGCSCRAGATTSPPRCSCTRRPCATAWVSSASSTATGSRTRTRCWSC